MNFRKRFKPAAEIQAEYGGWKRPDEKIARSKYIREHTHHNLLSMKTTHVDDLKEFGQGHLLYFYFLKYMAILFCALAVMPALPMIMINISGAYFVSADLERTTAGNFGLVSSSGNALTINVTGLLVNSSSFNSVPGLRDASTEAAIALLFMGDASKPPASSNYGWSKRGAIVAMAAMDVSGALVYFITTLSMIYVFRVLARNADDATVMLHDYSVRVQDLPKDTEEDELRSYLEKYGDIQSVELARSVSDLLRLVYERKNIIEKLDTSMALLQRHAEVFPRVDVNLEADVLQYKLQLLQVNKAIRLEQLEAGSTNVVTAFVVFKEERSRHACLKDSPRSWTRRFMTPREKRFRCRQCAGSTVCGVDGVRGRRCAVSTVCGVDDDDEQDGGRGACCGGGARSHAVSTTTRETEASCVGARSRGVDADDDDEERDRGALRGSGVHHTMCEVAVRDGRGAAQRWKESLPGKPPHTCHLMVRTTVLRITPAPEPSDVMYENLEVGGWQRFFRRVLTLTAKNTALIIGFVLINLAPAIRVGVRGTGGPSHARCGANCAILTADGNYAMSSEHRADYQLCYDTGAHANKMACEAVSICYECWCRAVLNAGTYGELFYCSSFAKILALGTMSQIVAVLGIVLVNFAIYYFIIGLTTLECHHTRSKAARSTTSSVYQSQFINTAFSSIIANAYLPSPGQ
ncbi:MAG: hypothetical protein WDW38_009187 [Sanguina aurantia]